MENKNVFTMIGARNNALSERQKDDFYATEPKATDLVDRGYGDK